MFVFPSKWEMWCECINPCKHKIWRCAWNIITEACFGPIRNTATETVRQWSFQVGTLVTKRCRDVELQSLAVVILNTDCFTFFLWNELKPHYQQWEVGVPGVRMNRSCLGNSRDPAVHYWQRGLWSYLSSSTALLFSVPPLIDSWNHMLGVR